MEIGDVRVPEAECSLGSEPELACQVHGAAGPIVPVQVALPFDYKEKF